MVEFDILQYVGIFILILFSGLIDSIAGGGGLISIPTYIVFGIPAEFLLGTNKTVSTSGTTLAVSRFIKEKKVKWKYVVYAIAFALVGSSLGARISHILSKEAMTYLLIGIVPVILVLNVKLKEKEPGQEINLVVLKSILIGLFIGFYDGFFGPGTGTFLIFAFVVVLNWDYGEASANARIVNYASNLSAFIYFLSQGKILWTVAIVAICGSLIGNWIGSGLVIKKSSQVVRPMFNVVLTGLLLKCLYDIFYL